jgi:hypothetical protein
VRPAGPITNFDLETFTEPVKIQLINPLLGANCYIGSDSNPIVLNTTIVSIGPGSSVESDPDPTGFPKTVVFNLQDATAVDNAFSAGGDRVWSG